MTFSMIMQHADKLIEDARKEGGEKAADEARHGIIGAVTGMAGGSITGAVIGTAICPGIGTGIGAAVGSVVGYIQGTQDKTTMDNVTRAGSLYRRIFNMSR